MVCHLLRRWTWHVSTLTPHLVNASERTLINNMHSLVACGLYFVLWIYILPHFGKYRIRQELIDLDSESAKTHRLVKVALTELEVWDAEHDVLGQRVALSAGSGNGSQDAEHYGEKDGRKHE